MKSNNIIVHDGTRDFYRYHDDLRIIMNEERRFYRDFNVTHQKIGLPVNNPTINEFRWSKSRGTYFHGSMAHAYLSGSPIDRTVTTALFGVRPDTFSDLLGDGAVVGKAYSRFLGKIRNASSNLAVDVAEAGQTYRMVTSAVDTVVEFARKARKHPRKVFSDAWLQYSYGWLPALSSIYSVATFSRTNLLRFHVRAGAQENLVWTGTRLNSQTYPVNYRVNHSATIRWGCTMNVKNTLTYDLSRLTSLNPLAIAWELVPYSFVVDWFYDIGGFLDEVETVCGMGYKCENIYRTIHRRWLSEQKMDFYRDGYYNDSGSIYCRETVKGQAFSDYSTYQRVPFSYLPLPSLPTLSANLGASRILSGAALLSQLRK